MASKERAVADEIRETLSLDSSLFRDRPGSVELHPTPEPRGAWATPETLTLTLADGSTYRVTVERMT